MEQSLGYLSIDNSKESLRVPKVCKYYETALVNSLFGRFNKHHHDLGSSLQKYLWHEPQQTVLQDTSSSAASIFSPRTTY